MLGNGLLLGLMAPMAPLAADERQSIAIIANPTTRVDALNATQVADIWLGRSESIDGVRLQITDRDPNESIRTTFYNRLAGMDAKQLKSHWARTMFIGRKFPPKSRSGSAEVIDWVRQNRNAVAYVYSSDVPNDVRVLFAEDAP